jgi:hypothetical protein
MPSIRTTNKRRRSAHYNEPVKCPTHGLPYQGAGWVYAAGLRFAMFECPRALCNRFELLGDKDAVVPVFSDDPF